MTGYNKRDANLKQTKALHSGAGSDSITGFDLGLTTKSDFVTPCELLLTAPALTTSALPDAGTMIYTVETDDNSSFSSATNLGTILTQTGAGGAGAAAATARWKPPTNVERYIRVKATKSGTGDASGVSMTVELLT